MPASPGAGSEGSRGRTFRKTDSLSRGLEVRMSLASGVPEGREAREAVRGSERRSEVRNGAGDLSGPCCLGGTLYA